MPPLHRTTELCHAALRAADPVLAAELESELGALRLAPSSTPTPCRSTSSPPSQPVAAARAKPANESTYPTVVGSYGIKARALPYLSHQLPTNSSRTITLPIP